jgi:hypothetical protein
VKGQQGEDKGVRDHRRVLAGRARQVLDDGDGDGSSACRWSCLGASRCVGVCVCERRELGKDGANGATRCTGASRASSGRAHRVPGTFWARLGSPRSANAGLDSIQGGYRRAQGGAGKLADMVLERGKGQRG